MTDAETGCSDLERWADGSWYLPTYAEEYFLARHHRIEYVAFEQRIASLAWLHNKITSGVDTELAEMQEMRRSGTHRVPGWEVDSDHALRESELVLDTDVRRIGSGVILSAAVAALESLMNQMLDQPTDYRLHKAGLTLKARELASRWDASIDRAEFDKHIAWLRTRRNSFAHRLIDDVDRPQPTHAPVWDFDDEAADEALGRISAIASMLEEGWEQRLRLQAQPISAPDNGTSA
ncbi:hypothetical protein [Streptomyces niveus]|uniref:Uncharacterized protein n=1 Tax=Streptomyces niveus TaxID=193462 RepID=A0A1U9QWX1_STRNV|nr:hypothetical protein [Streptomyces niveus]AQU68155.1 hypothetical protein BBN63_19985 [Streptomyces niveus]